MIAGARLPGLQGNSDIAESVEGKTVAEQGVKMRPVTSNRISEHSATGAHTLAFSESLSAAQLAHESPNIDDPASTD